MPTIIKFGVFLLSVTITLKFVHVVIGYELGWLQYHQSSCDWRKCKPTRCCTWLVPIDSLFHVPPLCHDIGMAEEIVRAEGNRVCINASGFGKQTHVYAHCSCRIRFVYDDRGGLESLFVTSTFVFQWTQRKRLCPILSVSHFSRFTDMTVWSRTHRDGNDKMKHRIRLKVKHDMRLYFCTKKLQAQPSH